MALTKISGDVIQTPLNVGVITATSGNFSGIVTASSINATTATFSGNVSIAGTLTYEDVTNIDSIGVVTARSSVIVGAGLSVVGVTTLASAGGITTAGGTLFAKQLNISGVSTFNDNVKLGDNVKVLFGTGIDLEIFHDGSDSYIRDIGTGDLKVIGANLTLNSDTVNINNAANTENLIRAFNNGAVNLYYDNSTRLETYSSGIIVSGGRITGADGSNFTMSVGTAHNLEFRTNDTHRLSITSSGHTEPALDNTYNLGSTSFRWANIYSADLQLSNEGSQNEIDGTWGTYTIQEGENNLFLINRRTGKRYKFLLEEVK